MNEPARFTLHAYLDKILDIQKIYQDYPLTEQDLKQLAFQMGMDEEDWQRIQRALQAHLERGQGYCRYFNWADAITEFKHVITLNPNHIEALYGLALAYKNLWLESRQIRHQERASFYAKKCLTMNPKHDAALRLVSELKLLSSTSQLTLKQKIASVSTATVLFAMVIGVAVILFGADRGVSLAKENKEAIQQRITTEPIEVQIVKTQNVPVFFVENEENISLNVEQSALRVFEDALGYEFKGALNITQKPISSLKIQLELLNAKQEVLLSELIDALKLNDSPAQVGDALPFKIQDFYRDVEIDPKKIASVRLSVHEISLSSAPLTKKSLELDFSPSFNPQVELLLAERESKLSHSEFSHDTFHRLVLEVKNQGKHAIKKLNAEIQWFDAHQAVILTQKVQLIGATDSPLQPSQVRAKSQVFRLKNYEADADMSYRIVLLSAE